MKYSINILDWFAVAPGLSTSQQWFAWANGENALIAEGEIKKSFRIPMMTARRMSMGSRLAVDAGLALMSSHSVEMAIFTSRHGELERTYKILQSLIQQQPVSPTDFSMSVHNTAAGYLTITGDSQIPVTSLAAGADSFQQGLMEAQGMFAAGAKRVMLIDFDGIVPEFYQSKVNVPVPAYAVALLLEAGDILQCTSLAQDKAMSTSSQHLLPQSLVFLRHWLRGDPEFTVEAEQRKWLWTCARSE